MRRPSRRALMLGLAALSTVGGLVLTFTSRGWSGVVSEVLWMLAVVALATAAQWWLARPPRRRPVPPVRRARVVLEMDGQVLYDVSTEQLDLLARLCCSPGAEPALFDTWSVAHRGGDGGASLVTLSLALAEQ